jgi:hypothetical protein
MLDCIYYEDSSLDPANSGSSVSKSLPLNLSHSQCLFWSRVCGMLARFLFVSICGHLVDVEIPFIESTYMISHLRFSYRLILSLIVMFVLAVDMIEVLEHAGAMKSDENDEVADGTVAISTNSSLSILPVVICSSYIASNLETQLGPSKRRRKSRRAD